MHNDDHQKLSQLEGALGLPHGSLPMMGKRERYVFTTVDGVTVLIGPRGGCIAPALRSYNQPLDVRTVAKLSQNQQERDRGIDPARWQKGHLSPAIGTDWRCGDKDCPCSWEPYGRRVDRSLGFTPPHLEGEGQLESEGKRPTTTPIGATVCSGVGTTEVRYPFLKAMGVTTTEHAMKESLLSALGHNPTYSGEEVGDERVEFRAEWARLIRDECGGYTEPVGDDAHCQAILRISKALSGKFGNILLAGQLRYGTSQKAFNLYLKYVWQLENRKVPPPHCPVDRIMLKLVGVDVAWTQCNSVTEYMSWLHRLRAKADPLPLAIWEDRVWYDEWRKNNG